MPERTAAQALTEFRQAAKAITDETSDPYWAANDLNGILGDSIVEHTPEGQRCTDLYLILAALTDTFELGPVSERDEVRATILRFISEWLALEDEDPRLQKVVDRWYQQCGYERPKKWRRRLGSAARLTSLRLWTRKRET